jgi:hypothetical protein
MLGAVAGFLTIRIARLERVAERKRALRSPDSGAIDSTAGESIAAAYARRMALLGRAIVFAVLSALVTAALLIMGFLIALAGLGHGKVVAMMFSAAGAAHGLARRADARDSSANQDHAA